MLDIKKKIINFVKNIFVMLTLFILTLIFQSINLNAQENVIILTSNSPDTAISNNNFITVYGTADKNHVTIEAGANAKLINFPGANTIKINSNPCLFTVRRSGAAVIFEGIDKTYLKMPATKTAQNIIFDDQIANEFTNTLVINSDKVMLGEQEIKIESASIGDADCTKLLESRPTKPQIGVNFISFYMGSLPNETLDITTYYLQPEWIFNDFAQMGIHTYRQFVKADLLWDIIEPEDDQWHFDEADAVIPNLDFEPIVILFAMQYASATPPWETDSANFQKTLGDEAKEYLEKVIERYGRYVRYWEIGNEMDHWQAYDPDQPPVTMPYPNLVVPPSGGFSPQEQGLFLSQAAAFIKERDPDAFIVMPGMSGLNGYIINEWLKGVIEGANGSDWFDVINYHYYPEWQSYINARASLKTFIDDNHLENKAVWLTETGSTASETLTIRTDYPNSYDSQASDIFRRIIPAYSMGDSLVMWHTYIDSIDSPTNNWRLYGVRSDQGVAHPSYYALQLLAKEILPFDKVEALASFSNGVNEYKIKTLSDSIYYAAWGEGVYTIPSGITKMTSVVPENDGSYTWESVQSGDKISLTAEPFIFK